MFRTINVVNNFNSFRNLGNLCVVLSCGFFVYEVQVGVKKEVQELMASKDLYHVVVQPGIDQAFVFGVIATLDYIYGESTRC